MPIEEIWSFIEKVIPKLRGLDQKTPHSSKMRMIRESREFVLDFFSTKGGRVVILPPYGENLMLNRIINPAHKKINYKKKKHKCELMESLTNKGFDTTIVLKSSGESIELRRIHTPTTIKEYFLDAISVKYKEICGWKVSKAYKI